jgi:F-type H+-transporting ATPase subunit epsilon
MNLEILTPDKKVYEGEVSAVTVPGTLGSFQILKGHAPIISTLEDGPVIVKTNSESQTFNIKGGVVEVLENKVIVLAEAVVA